MKTILARLGCGGAFCQCLPAAATSGRQPVPRHRQDHNDDVYRHRVTRRHLRGGPGHTIAAAEGTIMVTAVQASASRVSVQVCHPTAQNHALECTVPPFARLSVGESLTATLRCGRAQVVTTYPDGCGAPVGGKATVTDTISVTLQAS